MKILYILLLVPIFASSQNITASLDKSYANVGDTIIITINSKLSTLKLYLDKRNQGKGIIESDASNYKYCGTANNRSTYKMVVDSSGTRQYLLSDNKSLTGNYTNVFTVTVMPNSLEYSTYDYSNGLKVYYSLEGIKINDPDNYDGVMVERSEGKPRKILRLR